MPPEALSFTIDELSKIAEDMRQKNIFIGKNKLDEPTQQFLIAILEKYINEQLI